MNKDAKQAYALARKYTNDTAEQFGGLKGAPCQISNIVHQNGVNIVTFLWENDEGQTQESQMLVKDGTPIYVWESGHTYYYGDLVIYASAFYRCITQNSDIEFDDTKWNEIGSPDGNYDIVQTPELLPSIFTPADRKMYYCISEDIFYFWNGISWEQRQQPRFQFVSLPTPSQNVEGKIYQYIGQTTASYTKGYWYICVNEQGTYIWQNITTQPDFHITVDDALSPTSENPVQNKVITHEISRIDDDISAETSARQTNDQRLSTLISELDTTVSGYSAAISAIQSGLENKVDKVTGKGLSKNDFTDAYKAQLDNLDLTAYQTKTLVTPITVDGVTQTTVEGALGAINGKTIDMDDALSSTSENAVMNRVIKSAVDLKQDDIGLSVVNGRICVTYEEE